MKLEELRIAHIKEINKWADTIEEIILPADIQPKTLHDYPTCRALADKMKRICQDKAGSLKAEMTKLEDLEMSAIEQEKYVLRYTRGGLPEKKKTFPSAEARERELRKRLANTNYSALSDAYRDWDHMTKDWATFANKLRQEMRLLENESLHNGGQQLYVSDHLKK